METTYNVAQRDMSHTSLMHCSWLCFCMKVVVVWLTIEQQIWRWSDSEKVKLMAWAFQRDKADILKYLTHPRPWFISLNDRHAEKSCRHEYSSNKTPVNRPHTAQGIYLCIIEMEMRLVANHQPSSPDTSLNVCRMQPEQETNNCTSSVILETWNAKINRVQIVLFAICIFIM